MPGHEPSDAGLSVTGGSLPARWVVLPSRNSRVAGMKLYTEGDSPYIGTECPLALSSPPAMATRMVSLPSKPSLVIFSYIPEVVFAALGKITGKLQRPSFPTEIVVQIEIH